MEFFCVKLTIDHDTMFFDENEVFPPLIKLVVYALVQIVRSDHCSKYFFYIYREKEIYMKRLHFLLRQPLRVLSPQNPGDPKKLSMFGYVGFHVTFAFILGFEIIVMFGDLM